MRLGRVGKLAGHLGLGGIWIWEGWEMVGWLVGGWRMGFGLGIYFGGGVVHGCGSAEPLH